MLCQRCKIEVKDPLELYDGSLVCPKCREVLNKVPSELKVTEKSRELFSLSELYFGYGIGKQLGANIAKFAEKIPLSGEGMISKAIEYCNEAAKLGHPEAVYRLGFYYDKDYIEKNKTEAVRCRIAAKLYLSVARSPVAEFEGYGAAETARLKRKAATAFTLMVAMLDTAERDRYSADVKSVELLADSDALSELGDGLVRTEVDEVLDAFNHRGGKRHYPLFGVFRLSSRGVRALAERLPESSLVSQRDAHISFIPITKQGTAAYDISWYRALFGKDNIVSAAEACAGESDECVLFFFFSGKRGRFFGARKRAGLLKSFAREKYDTVAMLINQSKYASYIFYDDDIYYYSGKLGSLKTAALRLVGNAIKN